MIGTLIGKGNTADVFNMGTDKVIKLFRMGYPPDSVRKEFENSKLLNGIDIPIAKSHELVTYNGRYGIVYDKIDGQSMQDLLLQTCDLEKYATALAILHKGIISHRLQSDNLKSILTRNIEHTNELSLLCKSKLISILDELPDGDSFCHGDFHFGNVIVSQEKNYIIDYMNVCSGHKCGDIARTVYLIEMTPVPAEVVDVDQFLQMKKYATDIYLKEMGVSRETLSYWLMLIAAARLWELSSEQNDERNTIFEFLSKCGL